MKRHKEFPVITNNKISNIPYIKLTKGLKAFKIIEAKETEVVFNSYSKMKSKSYELIRTNLYKKQQYKMRKIVIDPYLWNNSYRYYRKKHLTHISEKVWIRILRLSKLIKEKGFKEPEILLFWKKGIATVWIAFISLKVLRQVECLLLNGSDKEVSECPIHWDTRWSKMDPEKFDRWYGGMANGEDKALVLSMAGWSDRQDEGAEEEFGQEDKDIQEESGAELQEADDYSKDRFFHPSRIR